MIGETGSDFAMESGCKEWRWAIGMRCRQTQAMRGQSVRLGTRRALDNDDYAHDDGVVPPPAHGRGSLIRIQNGSSSSGSNEKSSESATCPAVCAVRV